MSAGAPLLDARPLLERRARRLARAGIAYNVVESAVALAAGTAAGSSALLAFGLDATVEIASGLVILWQFRHATPGSREATALRLLGICFFALAAWITFDSLMALVRSEVPEASPTGIVLALVSLAVMPVLARAQRRTGLDLHSASVVAGSAQTRLCSYMSAVLLAGLVLNAWLGWWAADPLAGLVIAGLAAREGWAAWRGDGCC